MKTQFKTLSLIGVATLISTAAMASTIAQIGGPADLEDLYDNSRSATRIGYEKFLRLNSPQSKTNNS
ncbi:MAG: hypothetical protein NXH75_09435, partial [Halobacteriovoraceae bacterium]|nr:hypothetical protein [Halobacteriovoraceae bacterium]